MKLIFFLKKQQKGSEVRKGMYNLLPFALKRIHAYSHICIEHLWKDSISGYLKGLGDKSEWGLITLSYFVFQFYATYIRLVSCFLNIFKSSSPLCSKEPPGSCKITLVVAAVLPAGRDVFRGEIDLPLPLEFLLQCELTSYSVYSAGGGGLGCL